jgi:hypothetical protein
MDKTVDDNSSETEECSAEEYHLEIARRCLRALEHALALFQAADALGDGEMAMALISNRSIGQQLRGGALTPETAAQLIECGSKIEQAAKTIRSLRDEEVRDRKKQFYTRSRGGNGRA